MERKPLSPRETIYNGIPMRSRLEARVAAWLDSVGLVWQYEPRAYATQEGQYLPDFAIEGLAFPFSSWPKTPLFLEVKGQIEGGHSPDIARRMELVLASADAVLAYADARGLERGLLMIRSKAIEWRGGLLMHCPHCGEVAIGVLYASLTEPVVLADCRRCWNESASPASPDAIPGYVIKMPPYQ